MQIVNLQNQQQLIGTPQPLLSLSKGMLDVDSVASTINLVFVDAKVEDYEVLLEGLLPGYQAFILSDDRDGVKQIAHILSEFSDVESLHIVSHGSPGTLHLGSTQLDLEGISRYQRQLKGWAAALSVNAQVLLYGCRVAEGDSGVAFVQALSKLTGAVIAASKTPVGSQEKGGNWNFEVKTRKFRPTLAFNTANLKNYDFILMVDAFAGIDPVDSVDSNQTGAAKITITPGSDIQESNFGAQSFTVENTGDKRIAAIFFDVTDSLFTDVVFDPIGLAGDTASRGLTFNSTGNTGVFEPDSNDILVPFYGDGGAEGYKGMLLTFDPNSSGGYNPGEVIKFGVDMDSNSIVGLPKDPVDINGNDPRLDTWDIGGVSGAELINSKVHVLFTDGTTAIGELAGDGSQGGSVAVASQASPEKQVTLIVNGLGSGASGSYSQSNIQVLVSGTAGDTARVVLTKGFIQPFEYVDPNGNPVDLSEKFIGSPFPANNALEFQTVDVLLDGTVQDITSLFDFNAPGGNLSFAGDDVLPIAMTASVIDSNELPLGPVTEPVYLIHESVDPITDITPPSASLLTTALSLPIDSTSDAQFVVEYTDNVAVDIESLGSSDLEATGPNGSTAITFVSADFNTDGTPRQATYMIAAPAEGWQSGDGGSYSIEVLAGEVNDTNLNNMAGGVIGTVDLIVEAAPPPDTTAPTANLLTTFLSLPADSTSEAQFTVEYADDVAVDFESLGSQDLQVTGPTGLLAVTFISADLDSDGTPRQATYAIAAPTSGWQTGDAGAYTIEVVSGEVTDTSLNPVATGSLGSLDLTINEIPPAAGSFRIEAEDYNAGSNGVEYFDTTLGNGGGVYRDDDVDVEATGDIGGGYNIGFTAAGEYLTYDFNLAEAGTYDITLRIASARSARKKVEVAVGGQVKTVNFTGSTGGWQTYQDFTLTDFNLAAGPQELRVEFLDGKVNLNYIDVVKQGEAIPDTTAPTANLLTTSLSLPADSTSEAQFTVEYADDVAVDFESLGSQDLQVTGPTGPLPVTFISADLDSDGTPRQATYAITAPTSGWQTGDAGAYTIEVVSGEVTDTSLNPVAAAALGSFNLTVNEVGPDTTPPTASLLTTLLSLSADSTSEAQFTVEYADDVAVDFESLGSQDLQVTGPNGPLAVTFISADLDSDGTPRQATYAITAPTGGWQTADGGSYSIEVMDGEVTDTNLNPVATGSLGSLDLTINEIPPAAGSFRIEAEDYKAGSNGVEYFDTTLGNGGGVYRDDDVDVEATGDIGGGYNIGFTAVGEYLTYDLNLAEAGTYDITLRIASARSARKKVEVAVGGQVKTVNFTGSTGGWQTYQDFTLTGFNLAAGPQELRVEFLDGKVNLNYIDVVKQGEAIPDTTAPTANLLTTSLSLPADSTSEAQFTVEYADDVAVDFESLGSQDLQVTGPNGPLAVTFIGADLGSDGTPRQATYAITAPTGGWQATASGNYAIGVVGSEVTDTSLNAVAAGALGSFNLTVEAPDTTAPTANLLTTSLSLPADSTSEAQFTVEYADDVAVDFESLGSQDLQVTGPNGPLAVTFISADLDSDGTPRQATYAITAPTGGWQTADGGSYSIEVMDGEVTDTSLNVVAAGALGSFNLTVEADTTAPTANLLTTSLSLPADSTSDAQFIVEYADNVAVDFESLGSQDLQVTGPNGSLVVTFISADLDSDGSPRQATYAIAAPTGGWQITDAGNYMIDIVGSEVSDTNSNFVAASNLGNLDLDVATAPPPAAIRINAGGESYTDIQGNQWVGEAGFVNTGNAIDTTAAIFKTEDDPIYQSARASKKNGGSTTFNIPVDNGNYSLNLHFAEIFNDDFGERVFDILAEGEVILSNLDVYEKSKNAFFPGKDSALVLNFQDIEVSDGIMNLAFDATVGKGMISGIEVIPIVGPQILLRQSNSETKVAEGGNTDSYEVVLNTAPTADVTVQLQFDGQQIATDQSSLVFTSENWNIPQTVTVSAVDDALKEGTETYVISHTVSSPDQDYDNGAIPDVVTTIADNDVPVISFTQKTVANMTMPTRGTWGPDGRLYVASYLGEINAYTFDDNYDVTAVQTISSLTTVDNPNILGIAFNPFSTSENPEIYVAHSLLYANGGSSFPETELSPYSGEISVLSGTDFSTVTPLITGLPVSNHDHGINGIEFDDQGDLLIAIGGNTNAGVPNSNIGGIPESPFAAGIIKAEITKPDFNGAVEYILPPDFVPPSGLTFDPEDSQTWGEIVDVAPNVDVSVYASGLRNPFDLVWTTQGLLYATDNGANAGLGNVSTSATTEEPFTADVPDELNLITEGTYYGHPNRNLGRADDRLNVYYSYLDESIPGFYEAPLATTPASTNGIEEYRATTFEGQLRGDLLAQQWNNELHRYKLASDGQSIVQQEAFTGITDGLDIVTGPGGAIVGIDLSENSITVSIPNDITVSGLQAYDIFPWRAPAIGGQEFVIGGTGFSDINDTIVQIGQELAQITYVSDNRIRGIFPEQSVSSNLLDITVSSGGEISTIPDAFLAIA